MSKGSLSLKEVPDGTEDTEAEYVMVDENGKSPFTPRSSLILAASAVNSDPYPTDKNGGSFFVRNRKTITRAGICCFCSFAIILPLTFLVIIPAIIKSYVDSNSVDVQEAYVISPSETSFTSQVTMAFSQAGPIPAKLQMKDITLSWNGVGGGDMVTLSGSNAVTIKDTPVTITSLATVSNPQALANFNSFAKSCKTYQWQMNGNADVTAIVKTSLSLSKTVTMSGFNNFSIPPVISSVNVTAGTTEYLQTRALVTMTSEATLALVLGQNLYFNIKSNGTYIGKGVIPNASLSLGTYTIEPTISLFSNTTGTPEQYAQVMRVQSNFSMGLNSSMELQEFYLEPSISWLAPTLSGMNMNGQLPGSKTKMIVNITLFIDTNPQIAGVVRFQQYQYNGFDVPITLTNLQAACYFNGTHISDVNQPGLNIIIPPKTTILTPILISQATAQGIANVHKLAIAEPAFLDIYSTISAMVEDFPIQIQYTQYQVPTTVNCFSTSKLVNLC